ncbi:MAG: DUF1549 domain-containing protein [Pirellulaceae bacterium]
MRIGYFLGGLVVFGLFGSLASAQQSKRTQMTARIDELVDENLRDSGWEAAPACSDENFLRRVHLDLTGLPPTANEVLDFLEDTNPDKRDALVSRLLVTPASAAHFASTWADWMLPDQSVSPIGVRTNGLQTWLRNRFAENLRYDRLVSDLLVSTGPAQTGPTAFFTALEAKPEKIAARTARVFMGVQLDCAECHDHPFDNWTQRDFWGFAAYFAQLSANPEQAMMGVGEVGDGEEGEVMLPGTEEIIPPKPLVKTGLSGLASGTRRQQLTLWLTTRENPFLAQATVNRVWALLMGRGLIEPVDDMRSLDIASHPQLLEELSTHFMDSGYDLRDLIQTITSTQAYRRATTHSSGIPPEDSYAVMASKPLTEKQLVGSLASVARQIAGPDDTTADSLAVQLGKLRGEASEAKLGIVSALVTLHGDLFDRVSGEESSRLLKALDAPHMDEHKQLRWLFLSVLSRQPTAEEISSFSQIIHAAAPTEDDPQQTVRASAAWRSDLLWALLNSSEFAMTP